MSTTGSAREPSTSLREAVARRHLLMWLPLAVCWFVNAAGRPDRSWYLWFTTAYLAAVVIGWRVTVRRIRRGSPVKDDERPIGSGLPFLVVQGVGLLVAATALAWTSPRPALVILPVAVLPLTLWLVVDQRRALRRWNAEVGPWPEPPPRRHFTPRDDDPR